MSFQQGLSGLNAASKNLDVIGHNVSNSSTVGFKGSVTQFADVFASSLQGSGTAQIGIGTKAANIAQIFTQGNITVTNNPLDVAINGKGFFRMSDNGAISFTRTGQFSLDKDGYIIDVEQRNLTGYVADTNGVLDTSNLVDLRIDAADLEPQLSSTAEVVVNLDAREQALLPAAFDPVDATTYHHTTSIAVFDTLGNPHVLGVYFMKTAAGTWDVFATADGTQIGAGAAGGINFTTDGKINTATTTIPLTVNMPISTGAATPLTVAVYFSGSTQFGSESGVNRLTQDGYASGRLAGFSITEDGVVSGRYTNGQTRTMGQMVLANFPNQQGLQPLGANQWAETYASGQPLITGAGQSGLGVLNAGAQEDSNVDLTQELVNMITAQRVYQANAQTIKTQDQVLQTLVNLR